MRAPPCEKCGRNLYDVGPREEHFRMPGADESGVSYVWKCRCRTCGNVMMYAATPPFTGWSSTRPAPRAVPWESCRECDGTGTAPGFVWMPVKCADCDGTGRRVRL